MRWLAGGYVGIARLFSSGGFRSFRFPIVSNHNGLRRVFRARSRHHPQAELIAVLNDVAAAVSSTISLEEILDIVVERAKRITDTDKAVLALTREESYQLDTATLVVRGSRSEHLQEWWAARLPEIAQEAFRRWDTHLELDNEHGAWLLGAPIRVKNRPRGLLLAINSRDRRFSDEQIEFLAILAAFAATAIENARLAEESKYVLLATERDRISREMHDGIAQSLFSVALGLELCRKQVLRDPAGVLARLEELQEAVDVSRSELRRFIYALRPVKLQELGLVGAIEYWVYQVTSGKAVRGRVRVSGKKRSLRPSVEAALYGVAKEAVSNIVRHADATRFEVRIDFSNEGVRLRVIDDGRGFNVAEVYGADGSEGLGLRSMRERIAREGGVVAVHSTPYGGTCVEVMVGS